MFEDFFRLFGFRYSRKSFRWIVYCNIIKEFFVILLDSLLFFFLVVVERFIKYLRVIIVYVSMENLLLFYM